MYSFFVYFFVIFDTYINWSKTYSSREYASNIDNKIEPKVTHSIGRNSNFTHRERTSRSSFIPRWRIFDRGKEISPSLFHRGTALSSKRSLSLSREWTKRDKNHALSVYF